MGQSLAGVDLKGLTVKQLREALKAHGLSTSGKKAELLALLQASTGSAAGPAGGASSEGRPELLTDEEVAGLRVFELGNLLVQRGLPRIGKKAVLVERLRAALAAERSKAAEELSPGTEEGSGGADFKVGDHVEAQWDADDKWHPAVVTSVSDDGSVEVRGKTARKVTAVERSNVRRSEKLSLARLQVGQKFRGRVQRMISAGAFVDIGADRNGLVRMSRMAEQHVTYGQDLVVLGQEVDVWVYRIPDNGRLGLSMIEYKPSPARDPVQSFVAASSEEWFDGYVRYAAPHGYYVDVKAHDGVSVAQGFLNKGASKLPEVGSTVSVRVTRVVQESGTLYLSMLSYKRA
uniref:SAP domain-containing protein n=1 Tax=Alexandrium catenella TaxID=2925 RepID=A0A7S1RLD5_ALECA